MNCVPAPTGIRVLADRHQEQCTGELCPGCTPCPDPHCGTCKRTHHDTTCPSCVNVARTRLASIAELCTHLLEEATTGRHARHVHTGIPGGDAVVLLVPGPTKAAYRGQLGYRISHELGVAHTTEEYRTDPRPVLTVLLEWETLWRARTHAPTTLTPTMDRVVDYLDAQLHHMAEDPELFDRLVGELGKTVHRLEDVLHDGIRPEVSRVPCLECGTRLTKEYGATEEGDHWVCLSCGELYDRGRFDRAKHDHLASEGAERYVALSDAAAAIGRPRSSVWNWVAKGLVQARRDPTRGTLVWWPDVRTMHLSVQTRTRS